MKIITEREMIRDVPKRWDVQYPDDSKRAGSKEISAKLNALDLNAATSADIEKIIGNASWVDNDCDECGKLFPVLVILTSEYAESEFRLCSHCAQNIALVLGAIEKVIP